LASLVLVNNDNTYGSWDFVWHGEKELSRNTPEILMPGEKFNWYYTERNMVARNWNIFSI
jgi:hypothetical protein